MIRKERNTCTTAASRKYDYRKPATRLAVLAIPLILMGLVGSLVMSAGSASVSVPGLVRIAATSVKNSNDSRYVTAPCPEGKRLVGMGGRITGGSGEVEMDDIVPRESPTGPPASVRVYAYETDFYAGNWTVTAYAICAFPLVGQEWRKVTSASNSAFGKGVTATCPANKKLLGAGGHLESGFGEVLMNVLYLDGSSTVAPTSVKVIAHESDTYPSNWTVTAHAICANPIAGLIRISTWSDQTDRDSKMVTSTCPSGTRVVGTGGRVGVDVDAHGDFDDYVISAIIPSATSVTVRAYEEDPITSNWAVEAQAVCATA